MALVVAGRLALLQSDYEPAKVFFEKGYALLQDECVASLRVIVPRQCPTAV